jgi:fatty acid desaturase
LPAALAQAGLVGIFWLAGSWTAYVWLWLLPLLTLTVLFNGVRVFCDHANLKDEPGTERDRLVSYVSTRVERFFLAPFHMNYHAEHHLFPYVPHHNLPRLRAKLRSAEPAAFVQWRGTYVGFLRRFLVAR